MKKNEVCVHYRECIGQCDRFGKGLFIRTKILGSELF